MMGYLLAHQGGWDEALLVAIPVAVLGGLIFLANRRADALALLDDDQSQSDDDPPAQASSNPECP